MNDFEWLKFNIVEWSDIYLVFLSLKFPVSKFLNFSILVEKITD